MACASRSSTQKSATASWPRYSLPTSPRHHPNSATPCTPSTTTWPTSPPAPGCLRQPENSAQLSKSSTQRVARPKGSLVGHSLGGGVPVGVVEGGERLVSSDGQLERSAWDTDCTMRLGGASASAWRTPS